MTALSIQSDPDFPSGGHAIIQAPFSGQLPAGDLELKIQHIQRKEWLTTKGWNNTDGSIIVPAANVQMAAGTLRIKVGRGIVDQFGYRDGLLVAVPALGVEGKVRLPESVRASNSEFGAGREIGAQTTEAKGPGEDLIRKDVVGEQPDQNKPAEVVGVAPPPVQPPAVLDTTPEVLIPHSPPPAPPIEKSNFWKWAMAASLFVALASSGAGGAWYFGVFPFQSGGTGPMNPALEAAMKSWTANKREYNLTGP